MTSGFIEIFNKLELVYTTQHNDVVNEFYVPVLTKAVSYDRVTGFFSSTALSTAARGISKFLMNPSAEMRMIVSSRGFQEGDEIENIYDIEQEVISEFNIVFQEDINALEDLIVKKRIAALGWLLKTGRLKIKVAKMTPLQYEQGILHSKFGILTDQEGHQICFSGSINESKTGWKVNGEVISVYKSTIEGQLEYIKRYRKEFDNYWDNKVEGTSVLELPLAIKNKMISYSSNYEVKEIISSIDPETKSTSSRNLRYYQEEAVIAWWNSKAGFLEMATGTGKTITAIDIIKKMIKENQKLGTIIVVPTNPLLVQWKKELIKEGISNSSIVCCSSDYPKWEITFRRYSLLETNENKLFVFTYQSLCGNELQEMISAKSREFFIICDEMHHAGAPKYSNCLNKNIIYRLGLSATPIRAYDIEGNQKLLEYFGKEPSLVFDIGRALKEINPEDGKTYLCQYNYHFETVELSPTEHDQYRKLSKQIAMQKSKSAKMKDEEYQPDKLRALLLSCAYEKISILDNLIKKIKEESKHKKMLFYCQSFKSKDSGEKQIESVKKTLKENNLNSLDFTSKFYDIEVRKSILDALRHDVVDAIIAIKCLDEGIDLPDVRTAVILASSSNSAEFIQRRGRILRNSPGKEYAELYDFLVGPPLGIELKPSDISLIKREFNRAMEYAKYSLNSDRITKDLYNWLGKYKLDEDDLND
jgi:superfamily II DNA or RNA helicase